MSRPFAVEVHNERIAIENAILTGTHLSKLAGQYDLSPASLSRYKRKIQAQGMTIMQTEHNENVSTFAGRMLDIADTARDARLAAFDAGHTRVGLEAAQVERAALKDLLLRLGVDDTTLNDQHERDGALVFGMALAVHRDHRVRQAIRQALLDQNASRDVLEEFDSIPPIKELS